MRSLWSQMPMLRIAFPLMLGIGLQIAATYMLGSAQSILVVIAVLFPLCLVAIITISFLKNVESEYRLRVFNGVALTILITSFGYMLTWFHLEKNYSSHFSYMLQADSRLLMQIDEPPVIREKVIVATAVVKEVHNRNEAFYTTGNVQLNFMRDSLMTDLHYGDVIALNAKIEEVSGPKNPGEFNFKNYLGFHNVYHKVFLTRGSWKMVDSAKGNKCLASIYKLRDSFLAVIANYVKDKNDFGVASAIMLGYRDYVNADIMRAYASSGTVHILSVSGLHVGIMFLMLNFLLKWMDGRGKRWVFAKAIFIILFIWFYACLTGLSPPVLRSAMMFSLVQIGTVLKRNINIYNILAGSAVLILLFDPLVLTDLGFQLSYLAVIGIFYLYPKISNLATIPLPYNPKFKKEKWLLKPVAFLKYDLKWFGWFLIDFMWQLTSLSAAAQLVTLPLCLLYFYQFPNLFLLSNLIVIPLSDLILFAGTALFALGHVPCLNDFMGFIFNGLIKGLDTFIFKIDQMPFALIKSISVTAIEMVLLYIVLILGCWLTEERRPRILITSLFAVLALCSFNSYKQIKNAQVKEIVVYAIPKHSAIAFISENKVQYSIDSGLLADQSAMSFHIIHHWWDLGAKEEHPVSTKTTGLGKLIFFEGKRILIIDTLSNLVEVKTRGRKVIRDGVGKDLGYYFSRHKTKVDIVIISGNPKLQFSRLTSGVDFNEIVFDSSNRRRRIDKWIEDCEAGQIKYWDVAKQGAYIHFLPD